MTSQLVQLSTSCQHPLPAQPGCWNNLHTAGSQDHKDVMLLDLGATSYILGNSTLEDVCHGHLHKRDLTINGVYAHS